MTPRHNLADRSVHTQAAWVVVIERELLREAAVFLVKSYNQRIMGSEQRMVGQLRGSVTIFDIRNNENQTTSQAII